MNRKHQLLHEFVEFIPTPIEEGKIYVSIPYATVAHKCCCGCGNEVVTPLSPTDWKLIFDGDSVSLDPSIGNWEFKCNSHYWIRNNRIQWADQWSKDQIEHGRAHDRLMKSAHYGTQHILMASPEVPVPKKRGLWQKLTKFLS